MAPVPGADDRPRRLILDFTVSFAETYHGPIDLLVQLVREEEVDAREIAVARVCEDLLRLLEASSAEESLDEGGDLLLLAATLLALKARVLLPREQVDLEEDLLPEDGLVENLLEYRRFRDVARSLALRAEIRAARYARGFVESYEEPAEVDLGDLNAFDLAAAYARLRRQTLLDRPHRVGAPMRPLRAYARDLLDRILPGAASAFLALFEGARDRDTIVGLFSALLELAKQGIVRVRQEWPFGSIEVALAVPPEAALARFAEAFPGEEDPLAPPAGDPA
ncbi:MAG TPA: ScpA family protein [Planctomycetota bacterium]|nr:ScpA family protein [Planctomycetota bacterium]